MMYSTLLFL